MALGRSWTQATLVGGERSHQGTIPPSQGYVILSSFIRSVSLTCPAAMQIYWNKRKCLHKKRFELSQDWFSTPTCLPFIVLRHQYGCHDVMYIRSIPYSDVLFAFWLLKFTIILNLLTEEMKSPDIPTYSCFLPFNKIFLTYSFSFTPE